MWIQVITRLYWLARNIPGYWWESHILRKPSLFLKSDGLEGQDRPVPSRINMGFVSASNFLCNTGEYRTLYLVRLFSPSQNMHGECKKIVGYWYVNLLWLTVSLSLSRGRVSSEHILTVQPFQTVSWQFPTWNALLCLLFFWLKQPDVNSPWVLDLERKYSLLLDMVM